MSEEDQKILSRIARAGHWVANSLALRRKFYAMPVAVGAAVLIGFERNLMEEPITEPEGLHLLASSVTAATDTLLPLFYGKAEGDGMDLARMRALTEIVVLGGKHDFAKQHAIHHQVMNRDWAAAATGLTLWLVGRGQKLADATDLADRIRSGKPEMA